MQPIRLLDLGNVSPVRSQSVYHAVAHAMQADTPDTIILVSSDRPYICIGYHQELEKEVDLAYCEEHHLPIARREVGGGSTYLDQNQVFIQWIFHKEHLPALLEDRFTLYIQPIIDTYQALGIDASYRPINDIHVRGKKIGGVGAAQIGLSEIVVGSLMFDFDKVVMSKVLKVSSEKMRDKILSSLEQYMTTMLEQLGTMPDRQAVKDLYLKKCMDVLQREAVPGAWEASEEAQALELDQLLASPAWLSKKGGLRQRGVKIHQDVRVVEAAYKAPGGLIRVTLSLQGERIDDITISGDFTILPGYALSVMEQALSGILPQEGRLTQKISEVYENLSIQTPGVTPGDFTTAILNAVS